MSDDEAWNEWFNAEHYRTAEMGAGWMAACEYKNKRIAELEKQVSDGLEYARQTYTRARLMDQKTPMMLKLLSRIERLLETLESEGGADTNPR